MEYVFGTVECGGMMYECVKTVGDVHSHLSGFVHVETKYPEITQTDDFRIIKKYRSKESSEACFDWYLIDSHRTVVDRFTPVRSGIESGISENQEAVLDIAELSDENSGGILELAEMIEEIESRVSMLEEA